MIAEPSSGIHWENAGGVLLYNRSSAVVVSMQNKIIFCNVHYWENVENIFYINGRYGKLIAKLLQDFSKTDHNRDGINSCLGLFSPDLPQLEIKTDDFWSNVLEVLTTYRTHFEMFQITEMIPHEQVLVAIIDRVINFAKVFQTTPRRIKKITLRTVERFDFFSIANEINRLKLYPDFFSKVAVNNYTHKPLNGYTETNNGIHTMHLSKNGTETFCHRNIEGREMVRNAIASRVCRRCVKRVIKSSPWV